MIASEAVQIAREWVNENAAQMPGFTGAHLMGGINFAPQDAPFAPFKDIDMNLIFRDLQKAGDVHDVLYKGRILEYGSMDVQDYRSAEVVLADPGLACNLSVSSILSDPTGQLAPLQRKVIREYKYRKWVTARCEAARTEALARLTALKSLPSPIEIFFHIGFFVLDLAGLVAVASLKPPTHRRALVVMKELLEFWGRPDLHEEALQVIGFANFNRAEVEQYQQACAAAFDKAVEVSRTPVPYAFKLHTFVKPYVVDGIQEIIDENCHREAMLWAGAFLGISNNAIQADGSDEDKQQYGEVLLRLFSDMGLNSSEGISVRCQQAQSFAEEIFQLVEDILVRNPEIVN